MIPSQKRDPEAEANARLIAAAPEMRELLRFAADKLAMDSGVTYLKEAARALLARIEGQA